MNRRCPSKLLSPRFFPLYLDRFKGGRSQDQAREGSLLGREATWGRMLLDGLGMGLRGRAWASASRRVGRCLPHGRIPTLYDFRLFLAMGFSPHTLICTQDVPPFLQDDQQGPPNLFSRCSLLAYNSNLYPRTVTSEPWLKECPGHHFCAIRII